MSVKRRDLFKAIAGLSALLPLGKVLAQAKKAAPAKTGGACSAKPAPKGKKVLKEGDKTAKRVKYVDNATTSKHKKYKAGQLCSNCSFYKPKKKETDLGWAKCPMVGNKYVSACGWCNKYKVNKKKKA
ncbi:MAG: high-potential iron-sulfur protein [Bacteriovoracaceae bacterium]